MQKTHGKSEMLERVARALAMVCNAKGQEMASKYKVQASSIPWRAFERDARAAIEAMREPTEAMIEAGFKLPFSHQSAGVVWQAMIDAALAEKKI